MMNTIVFSVASKAFYGWMKSPVAVPDVLLMALVGFVIVVAALALLIGLLYLFQLIFKFDVLGKIAGVFKKNPAPDPAEESADIEEEDEETAVAIAAAIACILRSEDGQTAPPFKIKSIKRIH